MNVRSTLVRWLIALATGFLVLVGFGGLLSAPAMAAIQLHGSEDGYESYADGDNRGSWDVTADRPGGTEDGDVLVATVAVRPHGLTVDAPSGWTEVENTEQDNGGVSTSPGGGTLLTYYKVVQDASAEPGDYTWDFSSISDGGGAVVGILAFGGVDTDNPISNHGGNTTGSGLTHTADAITTNVADAMVVSAVSYLSASDFDTEPQDLTEEIDENDDGGSSGAIGVTLQMAYGTQASSGSTGDKTAEADAYSDNGFGHLLALTPAGAQSVECVTFRDEFSSTRYDNQDGTANWASDWSETGDNGQAWNGDIEIDGNRLQLEGDGDSPAIEREADLSSYSSATFSFDYDESGSWEGNDEMNVYVSADGGNSWDLIHTFRNDQNPGTFSQDISDYIAADTRIRFVEGASWGGEEFYIDNVQIEACGSAEPPSPLADFHMDEDAWDGTADEVTDSTGNGHDGTGQHAVDTTDAGKICRGGSFDGSDDYVHVDGLSDLLNGTASLSFWIKTSQNGSDTDWSAPGVTGVEVDGGVDDIFWGWIDASGHIGVSVGDDQDAKSSTAINDGSWRHVVLTRNATTGAYKIYIDGNLDASGTTGAGIIGNTFSSIGRIEDTGGTPEYFQGQLDEVMVFDAVLTDSEVQTGYTNQAAGRNWDGSERTCPITGTPSCGQVWANVLNTHGSDGQVSHQGQAWDTDDGNLGTDKVQTSNKGECYPSGDPVNYCKAGGHVLGLGAPDNPANNAGQDLTVGNGQTHTINSDVQYRNITVESGGTLVIDGAVTVDARDAFTVGSGGSNGDATLRVRNVPAGEQAIVYAHNIDFTDDAQTSVLDIDQGTIKFAPSATMSIEDGSDLNCGAIATPAPETGDNWNQGDRRECTDTDGGVFVQSASNINILDAKARGVFYADGNQSQIGKTGNTVLDGLMQGAFTAGQINTKDKSDVVFGSIPAQDLCEPEVADLQISVSASASTCTPQAVVLTAVDGDGNAVPSYNGTVALSTSSGHGTWLTSDGSNPNPDAPVGSLSDPTGDDGAASYTFAAADEGSVTLYLQNTHADQIVITAEDASAGLAKTSGTVTFSDNAFVITPETCTGSTCPGAGSTEVVAGRNHDFNVAFWQRDPSSGDCAIDTGYDGDFDLKGWIGRDGDDPGGAAPAIGGASLPDSQPGSNNLTGVTFTDGEATLTLATTDVGKYDLNVLDDSSGYVVDAATDPDNPTSIAVSGSSDMLTVRPFAVDIRGVQLADGTANPGATAPGGNVFTCAGDTNDSDGLNTDCQFEATLAGVRWDTNDDSDGDGIPDGGNLGDNALTASYAWDTDLSAVTPVYPNGGNLGGLYGGEYIGGEFGSGSATHTNLQYDEVGSVTLQSVPGTDYLGTAGLTVPGDTEVTGRFIPHHFDLTVADDGEIADANTSGPTAFTYSGQPADYDTNPQVTITAENADAGTTGNYTGSYAKLEAADITITYPSTDNTTLNKAGSPIVLTATEGSHDDPTDHGDGTFTFTIGGASSDTFIYDRIDDDSQVGPFTADIVLGVSVTEPEDGVSDDGDVHPNPTGHTIRYGRGRVDDVHGTYGDVGDVLTLWPRAQYWNGSDWIGNSDDFDSDVDYGDPIESGIDVLLSAGTVTLSYGTAGVDLEVNADPGDPGGSAEVPFTWPAWLPGPGSAVATFGIFRGDDRFLYWQEQPESWE